MDDELHRPLGQDSRVQDHSLGPSHALGQNSGSASRGAPSAALSRRRRLMLGAAVIAAGAGALAFSARDPLNWSLGGRPFAVARIEPYKAPPEPPPQPPRTNAGVATPPADAPPPDAAAAANGRDNILTLNDLDRQSGVKVTRNGASGAGPIIIQVERRPACGCRRRPTAGSPKNPASACCRASAPAASARWRFIRVPS